MFLLADDPLFGAIIHNAAPSVNSSAANGAPLTAAPRPYSLCSGATTRRSLRGSIASASSFLTSPIAPS